MKVKSETEVSQSSDSSRPHGQQPPGSSAHGIFQARVLEWGAIAFSESLANNFPLLLKKIKFKTTKLFYEFLSFF